MTTSPEPTILILPGQHEHTFIDQFVSGKPTRT